MNKKSVIIATLLFVIIEFCSNSARASEMDILVNKLVEKGILTTYEAQILKAEAKEEATKELAQGKAVTAPEWTQKIKVKGDVRFRTQADWGKGHGPAHQELRNRVRARVGIEGTVNDQIKAGIRIASGSSDDPRSTNQTLGDYFREDFLWLDQFYINWSPELPYDIGDATVWAGKFANPFKTTALLWDGDITPEGLALQYTSLPFGIGTVPANIYANGGYFWLRELDTSQNDPMLYAGQVGLKMDIMEDWGATLDGALAYYDYAHIKNNKSYIDGSNEAASTNTTWSYYGTSNVYQYDYNLVDLMLNYDAKQIFDIEFGHGLYSDMVWNTAGEADKDFAWMAGAYLNKKKCKNPGDWKIYGEYRYIERDSMMDSSPDSDFYGFTSSGVPAGGGTNGKGFVLGGEYALFKNTVLGLKYYYTEPITVDSLSAAKYDEARQLLQFDVVTKF